MSETTIGLFITGLFSVIVASVAGGWAYKAKKTPEPTPIEKLWARLDAQDVKIDAQDVTIEGLRGEVGTLSDQVVAYRGGFLAFVSRDARSKTLPTGSVPIVPFTAEEQQAIERGLNMAQLMQVHRDQAEQ